ncbi:hypothetical protein FRC11_012049, partial [Ceratobasidium sp. 423]
MNTSGSLVIRLRLPNVKAATAPQLTPQKINDSGSENLCAMEIDGDEVSESNSGSGSGSDSDSDSDPDSDSEESIPRRRKLPGVRFEGDLDSFIEGVRSNPSSENPSIVKPESAPGPSNYASSTPKPSSKKRKPTLTEVDVESTLIPMQAAKHVTPASESVSASALGYPQPWQSVFHFQNRYHKFRKRTSKPRKKPKRKVNNAGEPASRQPGKCQHCGT